MVYLNNQYLNTLDLIINKYFLNYFKYTFYMHNIILCRFLYINMPYVYTRRLKFFQKTGKNKGFWNILNEF